MSIDFPPIDPRGRELILVIERAKYERWLQGQVGDLLTREYNRVVDILLSAKYRTLTTFQRRRLLQLYRELDTRIKAGYADVTELHLREMKGYAQLEAEVARLQATSTITAAGGEVTISVGVTLPKVYLDSIAKLPIQGLRIGEWFEAQAETMSREARRIIQQGLVEGKGTAEISRRILAPDRRMGPKLAPSLMRRARAEATAISRTTVNAVQNDAALASYGQLPASVSDSYRLVAVRDTRTTVICAALDGRVFRFDDPKRQVPPFHIGCRTGTIPVLKGAPPTSAGRAGSPMSMGSYSDWLKAQPATTQNAILGATRASLFRDGRMQLAEAIDQDNRVLTLPQLRQRLGLDQLAAR